MTLYLIFCPLCAEDAGADNIAQQARVEAVINDRAPGRRCRAHPDQILMIAMQAPFVPVESMQAGVPFIYRHVQKQEQVGEPGSGEMLTVLPLIQGGRGDGATRIAFERVRQRSEEGYDARHDDLHAAGELVHAAICYLTLQPMAGPQWPFELDEFKPGPNRIRELEKAGAFIAAEIDRLLRLEKATGLVTLSEGVEPRISNA